MNEAGELITTKDRGDRFSSLIKKYSTPLDNIRIGEEALGSSPT